MTEQHTLPTLAERYAGATHASNLKVEADRPGAADLLIAMGWSPSRLGAALLRLASEWDACEKPRRPTKQAIAALGASMPLVGERKDVVDLAGAKQRAHDWYVHELIILFGKLKTMPEVRRQLVLWAGKNDIADPEHRVAEVLSWWLDHTCPVCNGQKKERIANTPALSLRDCKACKGSGETRIPYQQGSDRYLVQSKRMLAHITGCLHAARVSLSQRLRAPRQKKV